MAKLLTFILTIACFADGVAADVVTIRKVSLTDITITFSSTTELLLPPLLPFCWLPLLLLEVLPQLSTSKLMLMVQMKLVLLLVIVNL